MEINLSIDLLLIANAVFCFVLTGLILTIQLVHYPLFLKIKPENFSNYEKAHTKKITVLVAPLMIAELLLAFLLFFQSTNITSFILLILVALIWSSTFFIQVPLHSKLVENYSKEHIQKLIKSNWIRTIIWLARSAIFVYLFF